VSDPFVPDDGALFETIYPALYRLASVVSPPECDPDDLIQDVTARALRRGPLAELANPTAYLCRSIINLAANERRRLGRLRHALTRLEPGGRRSHPEYPSDIAELMSLSPMNRAVLWLADIEGRSFDEIATMLDCSAQAARTRAARARRQVRRLIEDDA
jgi:RNA polymerase sigma-70 factor (ECF subfamily)